MADEQEEYKIAYKTISVNITTSMAVADNGDLYIFGKTPILSNNVKKLPIKLGLPEKYLFYRVVHISQGLNHGAAILQSNLDMYVQGTNKNIQNTKGQVKQTILGIVADQAKKLKEIQTQNHKSFLWQWDNHFLNFMKSKNYKTNVSLNDFRSFYREDKIMRTISYQNISEVKNILNQGSDTEPNPFEKYFMNENQQGKLEINLCSYYQLLTYDARPEFITLIWGNPQNGRLGFSITQYQEYDQIQQQSTKQYISDYTSKLQQSKTNLIQGSSIQQQQQQQQSEKKNLEFIQPIALKMIFIKICCGHHHTLAINEEKNLFVWGMGSQGCLGNGRVDDIETPTLLDIEQLQFEDIASGAFHSLALSNKKSVFGWGVNSRGQLGIGNKENQLTPKELTYFERKNVECEYIFCGDQHSACTTTNKELYTWGNGDYYRLGHGMLLDELEPKKIEVLQDVYVLDVALGTIHSMCITNEGFVYAWGSSKDCVLGMPTVQYKDQTLPQRVGLASQSFRETTFSQIAAGPSASMALSKNGHLYTWGSNKNSLLGIRIEGADMISIPQRVKQSQTKEQAFEKAAFYNKINFEDQYNKLFNKELQQITYQDMPILKMARKNENSLTHDCKYRFASLGNRNSFFIDQTGHLYACGSNQNGLLCKNPDKKQKFKQYMPQKDPPDILYYQTYTPIELVFFKNTIIKYISCSYNHCIAITSKGNSYCWGANQFNQLGLGFSSEYVYTPILLEGAIEQKNIVMAVTGEKFSALLTDQGEVWNFGTSESGVLGHEDKNFYVIIEPRMINDIQPMVFITCSNQTMFSIDQQQTLWAWGNNQFGQLGISLQREEDDVNQQSDSKMTTEMLEYKAQLKTLKNPEKYIVYVPQQLMIRSLAGEAFIEQISCGLYHSCVITTNQELLTCGMSKYSGHGSFDFNDQDQQTKQKAQFVDTFSSTSEHSSKKFKLIACHEYHTIAVTTTGELVFLGPESKDQGMHARIALLGREGRKFPYELQNAKFLACGMNHSILINEMDEVYSWGSTNAGKLGINALELQVFDQGKEKKTIDIPKKMQCESCKEAANKKNSKEKEKQIMKKSSKKKRANKGKKKGTNQEDQVDVSIDDDEILDEESFHSEEDGEHRVQDQLQKGLNKQSQECEQENLYLQDFDIEKKVQFIFRDSALQAFELQKEYTEVISKLSWNIDYRARELAARYQSKIVTNLKFSVPQFIVKNIQLYELIFSCLYHHPCYMIKLIQTNQLNKIQLLKFINVIYKNELMESNNQSIILTLAIKSFEIEFNNSKNQLDYISELKLFNSSSVFLQIYHMFILKDEEAKNFFENQANYLIYQFMLPKIVDAIRDQIGNDKNQFHQRLKHFFNFHQESAQENEIQFKYEILTEILIHYITSILHVKFECLVNGESLISIPIKYLHNQLVQIIKKKILQDELERIAEVLDDEFKIQEKLQKFQVKLDEKIDSFLLNLYFGTINEFILQIQDQQKNVNVEIIPFLQNEQNLRQIVQAIDRFFQKDPMLPNKYNQQFNKIIQSRQLNKYNLVPIQEVAKDLFGQIQFSVENLNMTELIQECFSIQDRYIQVDIQDILFLQHFYCSQILNQGIQAVQNLFVRGIKDPIYIVLKHLQFREIQVNKFSTEILKRKINLKLLQTPIMQLIKKQNDISLYKCEKCSILLTQEFISNEKLKQLNILLQNGWQCQSGHYNKLTVLDCESPGCSNFMTENALKTLRVLQYYYREKDDNIDILVEILQNIPMIQKGLNIYNYLRNIQNTNSVKKNQRLTNLIERFITKIFPDELVDTYNKLEKEDEERYLLLTTDEQKREWNIQTIINKKNREDLLHKNYRIVYEKAIIQMNQRQQHRNIQLTYNDLIKQLEITNMDNKIEITKQIKILKEIRDLTNQFVNLINEDQIGQTQKSNIKVCAYGFYTSANMLQANALVKLTFQNRQIPKILKNVKFYFFGEEDGGWKIQLVYQQDSLLNLLITCVPFIYPIELSLYNIKIPIEQCLELRRMAKYRTQITFKSQNIEITFNIVQLIQIFDELEARLIK